MNSTTEVYIVMTSVVNKMAIENVNQMTNIADASSHIVIINKLWPKTLPAEHSSSILDSPLINVLHKVRQIMMKE